MCKILTASSNKKRYSFADIGLAVRTPAGFAPTKECFVRVGLANGTKRMPSQHWINLLSELHVSHKQCLAGISNAFSASFTSIWPFFPRFHRPQQSVPTLRYTHRHLQSAVPWISKDHPLFQLTDIRVHACVCVCVCVCPHVCRVLTAWSHCYCCFPLEVSQYGCTLHLISVKPIRLYVRDLHFIYFIIMNLRCCIQSYYQQQSCH